MGLPHRAIEEFHVALVVNPDLAIVHFNLGIVYHDLDRMDSAKCYWETYLRLEPDGVASEDARAHLRDMGG